jgi:hypothetical protein
VGSNPSRDAIGIKEATAYAQEIQSLSALSERGERYVRGDRHHRKRWYIMALLTSRKLGYLCIMLGSKMLRLF